VKGTRVRVGIDAPRAKPVHRWEIYQRIRSQRVAGGYR
jgi:sRNA-binding carbon storage regulator CsrA